MKYLELSWGIHLPLRRHLFWFIVLHNKLSHCHFNDNQDNTLHLSYFSQFYTFTYVISVIHIILLKGRNDKFKDKKSKFQTGRVISKNYEISDLLTYK